MNPSSAVPQASFTYGSDPFGPEREIDLAESTEAKDDIMARSMRGLLAPGKRQAYCLAGRAVVTIKSITTGTRFTLRIKRDPDKKPLWFVSLLTGPENDSDYQYMGIITPKGSGYTPGVTTYFNFRVTAKSRIGVTAPSMLAASFLATHFEDPRMEVWHEGRCGRCGRTLTVPESIASGIGPTCAGL